MDDEPLARLFTDGVKAVAPGGVLGNPHGMSSGLGFACLNAAADLLAEHATTCYRLLTKAESSRRPSAPPRSTHSLRPGPMRDGRTKAGGGITYRCQTFGVRVAL